MAKYLIDHLVTTSWAGNNNANLIGTASCPSAATLAINAPALDTTCFSASTVWTSFINDIVDWSVAIESRLEPAHNSSTSALTYANGYASHVRSWNMTMNWPAQDVTEFDASTPPTAKEFAPGLGTVTGTYEAFLDDSTDIVLPGTSSEGAAVFKVVEDGANDFALEATINTTQISAPYRVGEYTLATFSYQAVGPVQARTGSDEWDATPFDYWITQGVNGSAGVVGDIGTPATGALVLTEDGGTRTGDAFPSSIAISAGIGQIVTINVTAQGSGTLTIN
jgi:hypothetical protein